MAEGDITRSEWIRKRIPQIKLVRWLKMMIRRNEAIRRAAQGKSGKKIIRGKGSLADKISQATGWQAQKVRKGN